VAVACVDIGSSAKATAVTRAAKAAQQRANMLPVRALGFVEEDGFTGLPCFLK
jgi:hypothetical protein